MREQDFIDTQKKLDEVYMLLKENNVLLHEIIKQNHLIAEITLENIEHFSPLIYSFWPTSEKVKEIKKELDTLYGKFIKKNE